MKHKQNANLLEFVCKMVQKTMEQLPQTEGVLGSENWHLLCDNDVGNWSMSTEFLRKYFLKTW